LAGKIFRWYEFFVLILFSPIFLLISIPIRIWFIEEYLFTTDKIIDQRTRVTTLYEFRIDLNLPFGTNKTQHSPLGQFLIKTGLARLPQLINILKGDISFFE